MTKSELVKALEQFDDNAEVYVQIADSINEGLHAHMVEKYYDDLIIVSKDAPDYISLSDYANACVEQENLDYDELLNLSSISDVARERASVIMHKKFCGIDIEEELRMHAVE